MMALWGAHVSPRRYHITNKAIEVHTGLCCKSIEHIDLWRMKDISYQTVGLCQVRMVHGLPGPEHARESRGEDRSFTSLQSHVRSLVFRS